MEPQDVNEVRYAINRAHDRLSREFSPTSTVEWEAARWQEIRDLEWALRNLLGTTQDWQTKWRRSHPHPVTRWDLEGDECRKVLDSYPAAAPACKTCGHEFATEGDFWKHYVVPDIEYRNIGTCWTRVAAQYADTRPEWPASDLS